MSFCVPGGLHAIAVSYQHMLDFMHSITFYFSIEGQRGRLLNLIGRATLLHRCLTHDVLVQSAAGEER